MTYTRRDVLVMGLAASTLTLPRPGKTMTPHRFNIRTLTAGVKLRTGKDFARIETASEFLQKSKQHYESFGYLVQTLRIATQEFAAYMPTWNPDESLALVQGLDTFASANNVMFSIGPVNYPNVDTNTFADWIVEVIKTTRNISCSLNLINEQGNIDASMLRSTAKVIAGVSRETAGGEGNFRFAGTAHCPPGTPFFPAAYYHDDAFSIGLESADLLHQVISTADSSADMRHQIQAGMETSLAPVQKQAMLLASKSGRTYLGIDTSPAPNLDVSIGRAIESLSGVAFGEASTLRACATITDALKSLRLQTCGYSGLMLPILEDTVLAKRAMEKRYSISDLLLFSSVCGTGLDVVPLAGDISIEQLESLIGDVAALSNKYTKPLSARLFPVPGKKVGDMVSFDNPYLTDAVVMDIN